ncbi:MAG: hypothetical protein D4R88_05430, partial [Methanosarcinales archaeon]
AGFEAIIVSAKADLFGKEWLGRQIDKKLRIVKRRKDIERWTLVHGYFKFCQERQMIEESSKVKR